MPPPSDRPNPGTASPWSAGGWVCSEPLDHTSVLRFLEAFTGVREPNISAWRRNTFGDLRTALRFAQAKAAAPRLPDTGAALAQARDDVTRLPAPRLPGAAQRAPAQERGRRPRVAPT